MTEETKIIDTLENGDELTTLKALQRKVAATLDESTSGRDIAALSRQLREVSARIAELEEMAKQNDTVLDEIIKKHREQRVRAVRQ